MESKKQNLFFRLLIILFLAIIACTIFLAIYFSYDSYNSPYSNEPNKETRNYHIVITGTYENQLFLQQVYEGAQRYSDYYNSVVELYVPGSQAEDVPLQALLDYAGFVNADGVIVYNDTPDITLEVPTRTDGETIPLIFTGQYNANIPQVSFIGISYWELGKKISDESVHYLHDIGNAIILENESSSAMNYSTLLNSLQDGLHTHKNINYQIEKNLTDQLLQNTNLIICLTQEDTITAAQRLIEYNQTNNTKKGIIGFGSNETCQLYLDKGSVSELITVDSEKIGETAIRELFEYRNKGYANSYIAADVKILGGHK